MTSTTDSTLRLATWNTHHGEGPDGRLDLERVARTLLDIDADVVALQEVDVEYGDRSDWVDQAAWYRRRLGVHVAYGANIEATTAYGRVRRYGTAILSRHRLREPHNVSLSRVAPELEPRGLLRAEITVAGMTLGIFNTHLQSHHPPVDLANQDRLEQAREIHDMLSEYRHPFLLAGDFNAEPQATELEKLRTDYTDAWEIAGSGTGYTRRYRTPGRTDRRIDYVFASPDLRVRRAELVESDASDHVPLVVEVEL